MRAEEINFDNKHFRAILINKRMISRNISMQEAADEIGVSKATYSRIESGNTPDIETFIKVLNWLDSKAEYFINTTKQ